MLGQTFDFQLLHLPDSLSASCTDLLKDETGPDPTADCWSDYIFSYTLIHFN